MDDVITIIQAVEKLQKIKRPKVIPETNTVDIDPGLLNATAMMYNLGMKLNELRDLYQKVTDKETQRELATKINTIINSIQVISSKVSTLTD